MTIEASGPAGIETGGRLVIDLAAIQANYRLLRDRAGPAECAAVVKADAYGLGALPVAKALQAAGAHIFFVAHPFEARTVRDVAPDAVIYVLNGLSPDAAPLFAEIGARPVLGSMAEIEEWSAFARANNLPGDAALHVDTGMNRLGLTLGQADAVSDRVSGGTLGFNVSVVMSHLACGDEPAHPLNKRQLETFGAAARLFPGVPASLANSAGTLMSGDYRFDLCRPGIALYGGNPIAAAANPMQSVVRLKSRIVQIREAAGRESVGYGAAQTVAGPTQLAVLSIGYADGFLRSGGSSDAQRGADVIIAGHRCPLVGRVSMDLITVDITALPSGSVKRGDYATILGDGITVDDLAARSGTIGYEILTRLAPRFARTYKE